MACGEASTVASLERTVFVGELSIGAAPDRRDPGGRGHVSNRDDREACRQSNRVGLRRHRTLPTRETVIVSAANPDRMTSVVFDAPKARPVGPKRMVS